MEKTVRNISREKHHKSLLDKMDKGEGGAYAQFWVDP